MTAEAAHIRVAIINALERTTDSAGRTAGFVVAELDRRGYRIARIGEYAHLAKAIRDLLDVVDDMPIRNSDVDAAAKALRGELVDAGWDETPDPAPIIAKRPHVQVHIEPQPPQVRFVPITDPRTGGMRA